MDSAVGAVFSVNSTQPIMRLYAKIMQNQLDVNIELKIKRLRYLLVGIEVLIHNKLSEIV